jgi:hypothetical protein
MEMFSFSGCYYIYVHYTECLTNSQEVLTFYSISGILGYMNKHLSIAESVMHLPSSNEARKKRHDRLLPVVAGLGTVAAFTALGLYGPRALHSGVEHTADAVMSVLGSTPTFSTETVTQIAEHGDTTWDIAGEVDDPNDHASRREIVTYIKTMPENAKTFKDNALLDGESVTRPDHVE